MTGLGSLEKRVSELERTLGADDDGPKCICFTFVGVDPENTGPERAIRYPLAGYRTVTGDRTWWLQNGETPEQLQARAIRDAKPSHGVAVLMECYGSELT